MRDIKEAFEKVKLDIFYLNENLNFLREEVFELRNFLNLALKKTETTNKKPTDSFNLKLNPFLPKEISFKFELDKQTDASTGNEGVQTINQFSKTDNTLFKPLKHQIKHISIGNEGVQTDRQTNQQTDGRTNKSSYNPKKTIIPEEFNTQNTEEILSPLDSTEEILNSLDSLKKELRLKFKRLTNKELVVFSTIYQLEEQHGYSNYKMLSKKLNLTESSIRDYTKRLITKKIPLIKKKINNKEVNLFISPNLKKILPLDSLLRLVNI